MRTQTFISSMVGVVAAAAVAGSANAAIVTSLSPDVVDVSTASGANTDLFIFASGQWAGNVGETPIAAHIRQHQTRLANVHIEDMRRGVHEHLMFGEGEIDFPPVLAALAEVGYDRGVYVELSRHSHEAPEAARLLRDTPLPLMVLDDA